MVVDKALEPTVVVVDVKKPDQKAEEGIVDDSFSFINALSPLKFFYLQDSKQIS